MKLKKFNQFLKDINEDLDPREEMTPTEEYDDVDSFKKELGDEELTEDDFADEDGEDVDELEVDNTDEFDESEDEVSSEEEEEEGHEYKGSELMRELADKLGTEVVDNQIEYDGKVINYYSETEKFHIGRDKFVTIDEVLDFLGKGSQESFNDEELDEETIGEELEGLGESRRYIKRFN
jgi:hypothetical protein